MTDSNVDAEHLRLLSLFHYVVAGLAALFSLFPVLHLVLGLAAITGHLGDGEKSAMPQLMGWFFVFFASAWIVTGFTLAGCMVLAARFLRERRRFLFCLVVAGAECAFSPFGTLLGVFTIVVLVRPSVKAAFEATPVAAPPRPGVA